MASNARQSVFSGLLGRSTYLVILPFFMRLAIFGRFHLASDTLLMKNGGARAALFDSTTIAAYSAAIRTSGAAARTSASTCFSYLTKFSWNMRTSLRAVSSKAALSFQVFIG